MDERAVFAASERAGCDVHRGTVRANRVARGARIKGTDGWKAVLVREPAARFAARVLFHYLARGTAVATPCRACERRSGLDAAARKRFFYDLGASRVGIAMVHLDRHRH